MNIDDFTHDVGVGMPFTPNLVARMTSALRSQGAPWMGLATCVYYSQNGVWSFGRWPDLPMVLDAAVSFFRNEFQGVGPCVSTASRHCPWGPMSKGPPPTTTGAGACLAGACADTTVLNAPLEVAHMSTRVPVGRSLLFGFYATGHSSLGQPSAAYVAGLMQMAGHLPRVDGALIAWHRHPALQPRQGRAHSVCCLMLCCAMPGTLVYTTKATPERNRECAGLPPPLFGGEMGCIVREAFRRLRGDFLFGASCAAEGSCAAASAI